MRGSPPRDRGSPPDRRWGGGGGPGDGERPGPDRLASPQRPSSSAANERPRSAGGSAAAQAHGSGDKGWGAQDGWAAPLDRASDGWGLANGAANGWQAPASDAWGVGSSGQQNGWQDGRRSSPAAAAEKKPEGGQPDSAARSAAQAQAVDLPEVGDQEKVWYYIDPQVSFHSRSVIDRFDGATAPV